jgi:hypothetical protein
MTDRHVGYIVTLQEDLDEGFETEPIINAILMVKGVLSVDPIVDGMEVDMHVALRRIRRDFGMRVFDLYQQLMNF